MPRTRSTLRSRYWKEFFLAIRYCSYCGKKLVRRYIPAEQRKRSVCVGCGRITYVNPKVVAGVIPVMPDGKLVLLRRNNEPAFGKWSYPAGFQEMGESVRDAAEREAYEEIAVRVRVGALVGIYSYPDAGVVTIVFAARVLKGEKPHIGLEAKEVALFKWSDIPWKELAFRSTVQALQDWKKGKIRA